MIGTVYKISSAQTPKVYIGSTIQSLNKRFQRHKQNCKYNMSCSSKEILQYNDATIEKLYDVEVETIKELRVIERNEVIANNDIVVNKYFLDTKQNIKRKTQKKYDDKQMLNNPNFSSEHYNKYQEYQKAYTQTEEYKAKRRLAYHNKKNMI
tara:strand:+ start:2363 stop:2818 length:456 start_codon:yes stop_codon:yes gene_type:complete